MASVTQEAQWTAPDWLADVHRWIDTAIERSDRRRTGVITQPHIRSWSTVLSAPTDRGDVFFKATAPVLAHEATLTATLDRLAPGSTPAVLAVDDARGWMLLADGGVRLRERLLAERSPAYWERALARYAEVQVALVEHVVALASLGIYNRSPSHLPEQIERLLRQSPWPAMGLAHGLTSEEYQRLVAALPLIADLCEQLAACGIPPSLDHGDLHDGNIFLTGDRPIFFDWGDSAIAHPFSSLRTVFVSVEGRFDAPDDDPLFDRLADSYLQPWRVAFPDARTGEALRIVRRLWSLNTALKYALLLERLPAIRAESPYVVPSLLREFLAANFPDAG